MPAQNHRRHSASGKSSKNKFGKFRFKASWKNFVLYGFLLLFSLLIFSAFNAPYETGKSVSLSEVMQNVKKNDVKQITVKGDRLIVDTKDGVVTTTKEPGSNIYQLFDNAGVKLDPNKVKVVIQDDSGLNGWLSLLGTILPVALMIAFFYFIFRQARGTQESIFSFGQSRAKLFNKDTPRTSFADVAGVDEAKQELTEVVDFLKNPGKYKAMGARTPKGVLMVGPSGTGKTLLARATAGEAGVAFFSMAGSEFMEMLVGVGASRVRDLFNTAKKAQPAIIFIDEVDAIGRQRGVGIMGGHDEREQTLNQILVEMDGFTQNEQVVVMAASVTGDTPIMIKENNTVALIPIGEFVDSYYKENEEGIEKEIKNIQTLGFEGKDTGNSVQFEKPTFKSVRSVFRHRVKEIYEIEYLGGTIKATGNHSVFIQEGKYVIAKPVSELKKGDILVSLAYKLPYTYQRSEKNQIASPFTTSALPMVTLPVYLPDSRADEARTKYVYVTEQRGLMAQATMAQAIGVSQATVGHWLRQDRMPRVLSKAYFKHELPEEVAITPELYRLFGYYVAEGYARKEVDFCFNANEKVLIKDVIQLMELIFNLKPHKVRTRGNAVNIVYQSRPLATFFSHHCGKGAHNKRVPQFLFEAPQEYFIEFLRGVFDGDGYQDKRGKGEITSVSKQLILELHWLCQLHGIKTYMHSFIAKKGRIINGGKPLQETVAYRLGWGKMANPFDARKKNYAKLPRIQKIKKQAYDGYVYDLCGCENEAFFGGQSPILLHNTNRPDVLDPALIRPGRFDRRVVLDLPGLEGRKAILAIHAKGKPFEKNVDWEKAAKRTVGFSGADLENMLNEAAILAARLNKKAIDMSDLEEAATKVKLGPEKRRLQTDEDKRMTAYHEAGHALVSWEMPHMDPIHRISIVARGLSLGHTMMEPIERTHETKTHLLEQVAVMMGGRAAEQLAFKEMTTGASDDIGKATQVARAMVMQFGMSDLGPISLDGERRMVYEQSDISPEMAAKIDEQVKKITDSCYKQATEILTKLRDKLDVLAQELLKKETIEQEDFLKLIGPKAALATVKAK